MAATARMGAIFTFQVAPGFSLPPFPVTAVSRLTHDLSRSVYRSRDDGPLRSASPDFCASSSTLPFRSSMKPSNDMLNPMITLPITLIPYVLTGQRILSSEQLLGRAFEYHLAALRAAFGAHIDDPVCIFDHAGAMFDHNNRVAGVHQAVHDPEQVTDIRHV